MCSVDEEAYFQSMQENLYDMETAIEDGSAVSADIDRLINRMTLVTYDYNSRLDLPLFRARFDSGFDKTDPNQFGYIHNIAAIQQFRYNKDQEAVLYTATYPATAYQEIESSRNGEAYFYLSVWSHKDNAREFVLALNVNDIGLRTGTTAARFYNILRDNVGEGTSKLFYLTTLGRMLERPGNDYRFSSILASKIFENHDALMTTSMKSNGSELNVTFNQCATDNLLELKHVFRCEVPIDSHSIAYHVDEIGVPQGNAIEWHRWEIDIDSIDFTNQPSFPISIVHLRTAIQTGRGITQNVMCPNVNKALDDYHDGIVVFNGVRCFVSFMIRLL